jgi:hypothetical protein
MLEPDSMEQERELELEQAPVEIVTNHSLEQGKTLASHQYSMILILLNSYNTTILCIKFIGVE